MSPSFRHTCEQDRRVLASLWILALAGSLLVIAVAAPALGQTSADVEHAREDRDAAMERVREVELELEAALIEYDRLHTELDDVEEAVERTERQLSSYLQESSEVESLVRAAVIEAYVGSGAGELSISLGASTFGDVVLARYVGEQLRDRQQAALNRMLVASREIERLGVRLQVEREMVAALAADAEEASARVAESMERAEHELADAEENYAGIKAEFEEEQRRKREAELARIRQTASGPAAGLPQTATSGFLCPVQGGASFINSWGFPRSGGRTHKGVDMFAKRGTPAPAVVAGTLKMRTVNLGGIVSYLYGDDGNKYYYAHLDGYPEGLRDGQRVDRGQAIGYVGNSGNAEGTSPHVHFEIRPGGGNAVNPFPTVRSACP